jgi:hypothetical protein
MLLKKRLQKSLNFNDLSCEQMFPSLKGVLKCGMDHSKKSYIGEFKEILKVLLFQSYIVWIILKKYPRATYVLMSTESS